MAESVEDLSRDGIYRLLLSKLMEAQSSSWCSSGVAGVPSYISPPLSASSCLASPSSSQQVTPRRTTTGGKNGDGRARSPSLPSFLLVRVDDAGQAETLQKILSSHGYFDTRFVCANGKSSFPTAPPPPLPTPSIQRPSLPSSSTTARPVCVSTSSSSTAQSACESAASATRNGARSSDDEVDVEVDDLRPIEIDGAATSSSADLDSSLYVKCQLCENRIMNTRQSNLTNHVRRHATLKQFQCAFCPYEHNEIFKVRTHMNRSHAGSTATPLSKRTPEMERQWQELMLTCFPPQPRHPHSQQQLLLKSAARDGNESSEVMSRVCGECQQTVTVSLLSAHVEVIHGETATPEALTHFFLRTERERERDGERGADRERKRRLSVVNGYHSSPSSSKSARVTIESKEVDDEDEEIEVC